MNDLSNIPRNQLEAIFEDARVVADRLVYLTNLHGGCRDAREVALSILARYEKAYRKPTLGERCAKDWYQGRIPGMGRSSNELAALIDRLHAETCGKEPRNG